MIALGRIRRGFGLVVITAFIVAVSYFHAQAASLRWTSTAVKTNSVSSCFSFAQTAFSRNGYGGIRKTPSEVTGSKGGAYVAVTCIGTAPNATAVIMAVSDNDGSATQARDEVARTIKGVVKID